MKAYLGIDVGSVSTNIVICRENGEILAGLYLRTAGRPIEAIQSGLRQVKENLPPEIEIAGVGATGSGRFLAGVMAGADVIKNEITSHALAASLLIPDVQTVFEIGGQDSKIIILRQGVVTDFAMNTVCAAGTGSFLDQQAARLNIPIDQFGDLALQSKKPVRIAGRCTVFAESEVISLLAEGCLREDIIQGLHEAIANRICIMANRLRIEGVITLSGGVAKNEGMVQALKRRLKKKIYIPEEPQIVGALGAALAASRREFL